MYSVYQHWDRLKTCIVGRSYPPQFYSYITNPRVRNVMERIAIETEEDYQKLISLLESFNVEVLRPEIKRDSIDYYIAPRGKYLPPPMTPRDYSGMFGNNFYANHIFNKFDDDWYSEIKNKIKITNNVFDTADINTASITRIGKDLYFGSLPLAQLWPRFYKQIENEKNSEKGPTKKFIDNYEQTTIEYTKKIINSFSKENPNYRTHLVNTQGHSDGTFCPVVPGLIVSLHDIQEYEKTFPDWEVVYLQNQSWNAVQSFLDLKEKNRGKWWVPGEELNDDFTDFVETWLDHWVGYVEESVFDVNMLVIDKKNVVCNNYNKAVFDAFERHGITPHIVNFRHRYFWDGGLHCITSDIDREGTMQDYFPERDKP